MIRKFAISFFSVLALPLSSYALAGGPFDNGDYGSSLDDQGIYQYSMRFKNGSGIAQFGNNVDPVPSVSTTGGSSSSSLKLGSNLDRALVYYKGVTYYGNCSGIADTARKKISAITNGISDVTASSSSGTGTTTSVTATSFIVSNNGSATPCNTEFEGKIYTMKPILKFRGRGEITVINPQLSDVFLSAVQALITAQASSTTGTLGTQIQNLITGLTTASTSGLLTTTDSTYQLSDHAPMTVFGSRRFFISQR